MNTRNKIYWIVSKNTDTEYMLNHEKQNEEWKMKNKQQSNVLNVIQSSKCRVTIIRIYKYK